MSIHPQPLPLAPGLPTLASVRISHNLTVMQLAARSGATHVTIHGIERCTLKPRVPTIHRLCKALGVLPESIAWPGYPEMGSGAAASAADTEAEKRLDLLRPGRRIGVRLLHGDAVSWEGFFTRYGVPRSSNVQAALEIEAVSVYGLTAWVLQAWQPPVSEDGERQAWRLITAMHFWPWANIQTIVPDMNAYAWLPERDHYREMMG